MADEYLNGNVKEIIEPMITALLIAQPEDPKFFMLHWLKNLYSLDYIVINKEKEELENLRLEIRNYKMAKNDETDKHKVEQSLEQIKNIISDKEDEYQNDFENNISENKSEKNSESNNKNNINEDNNKNNSKENNNNIIDNKIEEINTDNIESKKDNNNLIDEESKRRII